MDNNNMKTIKFLKDSRIQIGKRVFRPYCISDLPNNFGCINYGESDGVTEWFGYKGFTYIPEN